jgi:hypothetical protein
MSGRPNSFTLDDIKVLWESYKKHTKDNPKYEYVVAQRSGEIIAVPREIPLTQKGFYAFVYNQTGHHIHQYFEGKNTSYTEFLGILTHIENERSQDIIEGAAAGVFNSSISARMEGLKEQTDVTSNSEKIESISVTIVKPNEDGN